MRHFLFFSICIFTCAVAPSAFATKYPFKEDDVDVVLIDQIEDYTGSPFVIENTPQSSGQSFFDPNIDDPISFDDIGDDTLPAGIGAQETDGGISEGGTGTVVETGGSEFVAHSTVGDGFVGTGNSENDSGVDTSASPSDLSFDGSFVGFLGGSGGVGASVGEESVTSLLEHLNISFSGSGGSSNGDVSPEQEPMSIDRIFSVKDLEFFVDQEAKKDTAIKNVQILGQSITVEYTQPARLFGIFSLSYTQKVVVTVSKKGMLEDVQFDKPWWTFFTSGDDTEQLEKQVRSEITKILEEGGSLSDEEVAGFLQRLGMLIDTLFALLQNFGASVKGLFG